MSRIIRLASAGDTKALLAIYKQYIPTPITFEIVLPTEEEFEQRILNISRDYPYLVYEHSGKVLGYAYAHRHMERWSYQWNAELSIYLDASAIGQGIGRQLYHTLIRILKLQNVKNIYGCVTAGNPNSEQLHEAMGFSLMGTYHNAGYKNGQWHDVRWYEKAISPFDIPPKPLISIAGIDPLVLDGILIAASQAVSKNGQSKENCNVYKNS